MIEKNKDDRMIQRMKYWGEDQDAVRATLLTSSRASPNAEVDLFSDYDVILVVKDIAPYFEDRSWLGDFGEVLVVYRDPIEPSYGFGKFAYITQYEDGTKIDFTLWPIQIFQQIIEEPELPPDLDIGYKVLLDKDGITEGLKPPTHKTFIPSQPTEEEYQEVIEVFFHESTYVAKNLWRDELLAAKYSLDQVMKLKKLRMMLEWRVQIDHKWSLKMGAYGRGLREIVKHETWSMLERTYVGAGAEENWGALFETIDLFRKVAIEVGSCLGFSYPMDLDRRMMDFLHKVKVLDPGAKTFQNE